MKKFIISCLSIFLLMISCEKNDTNSGISIKEGLRFKMDGVSKEFELNTNVGKCQVIDYTGTKNGICLTASNTNGETIDFFINTENLEKKKYSLAPDNNVCEGHLGEDFFGNGNIEILEISEKIKGKFNGVIIDYSSLLNPSQQYISYQITDGEFCIENNIK